MGVILDTLAKSDSNVRNCTAQAAKPDVAKAFVKTLNGYTLKADGYPDKVPPVTEETSAEGSMSGDVSAQDEFDEDLGVLVDSSTFDEKVRQLVEGAGAAYNYKSAAQSGLAKRVDPELLAATQRLTKAAPLLNEVVAITNLRRAKQGKAPIGSASESASTSVTLRQ